jgi:hypothetical protein
MHWIVCLGCESELILPDSEKQPRKYWAYLNSFFPAVSSRFMKSAGGIRTPPKSLEHNLRTMCIEHAFGGSCAPIRNSCITPRQDHTHMINTQLPELSH